MTQKRQIIIMRKIRITIPEWILHVVLFIFLTTLPVFPSEHNEKVDMDEFHKSNSINVCHPHPVRSISWHPLLSFSSQERLAFAGGSRMHANQLFCTSNLQPAIHTSEDCEQPVTQVAWRPCHDNQVAIGSKDGRICIRETLHGEYKGGVRIPGESINRDGEQSSVGAVLSLAWSHDGLKLAYGTNEGWVRIWAILSEGNKIVTIFKGHDRPKIHSQVNAVAWSPDDSKVASGANDNTIQIWDPETGRLLQKLQGHSVAPLSDEVHSLAWSPNGEGIASGSQQGFRFWDVSLGSPSRVTDSIGVPLEGKAVNLVDWIKGEAVKTVDWSKDGMFVAAGTDKGKLYIIDVKTKQSVKSPQVLSDNSPVDQITSDISEVTSLSQPLLHNLVSLAQWMSNEGTGITDVKWNDRGKLAVATVEGMILLFEDKKRTKQLWDQQRQPDQDEVRRAREIALVGPAEKRLTDIRQAERVATQSPPNSSWIWRCAIV